jgi:hypothetical protein
MQKHMTGETCIMNNFYSPNTIRVIKSRMSWVYTLNIHVEKVKCTQNFSRKNGMERALGRPRHRGDDNIKM